VDRDRYEAGYRLEFRVLGFSSVGSGERGHNRPRLILSGIALNVNMELNLNEQ